MFFWRGLIIGLLLGAASTAFVLGAARLMWPEKREHRVIRRVK